MARAKKPREKPSREKAGPSTTVPYPDFVKSDSVLKSILDRIGTGQHFRFSESTHFIAPLVQDCQVLLGALDVVQEGLATIWADVSLQVRQFSYERASLDLDSEREWLLKEMQRFLDGGRAVAICE